jgi:hypothetical protein
MNAKNSAADELLARLNEAVAAANEAEKIVTTAQADLVSRSKTVGALLLEAKKLHPVVKDFEAFLRRVDGLKLSRAYDLLRLAGGRVTDEELKKEARDRQRKSRASKRKLPKPTPAPKKPEPEPKLSVTEPDVTESAEASAERRKADYAAAEPADHPVANGSPAPEETWRSNAFGGSALSMFKAAADQWLPQMSESDRAEAINYVRNFFNKKEAA